VSSQSKVVYISLIFNMSAENQVILIKRVAPYLDTHVLLHLLKT
jgi:hypothetical protein